MAVVVRKVVIVIRFSIVPPRVPFLVSRFVFKRTGSTLDLDANEFLSNHLHSAAAQAVEPSFYLISEHVGIELSLEGSTSPEISEDTCDLANFGHAE